MEKKKTPLILVLSVCSFFFVVFIAIVALVLSSLRTSGPSAQKKFFGKGTRIGVVEVSGVIMDSKKTIEDLDRMEDDNAIKGVIVRINSPGGAVAPSQEIYQALKRLSAKKPVFSSMSSIAASGGYYIACGTTKIFADPGTITGSIGVIMQFVDLSKLYEWAKFHPYNIKTGRFKDIGNPEREMGADEKALLQTMMDNVLGQFRQAIVDGRKLPLEKVIELSDGRIFSGEQARNVHLVDELGGLREASEAMVAAVKGEGKPILVYPYRKQRMLIEKLFDDGEDSAESQSKLTKAAFVIRLLGGLFDSGSEAMGVSRQNPVWGPMYLLPLGR